MQPSYGQPVGYGGQAGYQQPASYAQPAASYGQSHSAGQSQYAAPYQAPMAPSVSTASPWKSATSPDGQVYYYNEQTGATQWDKPAGFT
jgi:hypothetical protein